MTCSRCQGGSSPRSRGNTNNEAENPVQESDLCITRPQTALPAQQFIIVTHEIPAIT